MRKWILTFALVAIAALALAACGGSDGNGSGGSVAQDDSRPPVSDDLGSDDLVPDDGVTTSPVCAPDVPDCEDTIVDTDIGDGGVIDEGDLPVAPPDIAVPPGEWQITIRFNETVQQDELDEVGALIRDFDPDAEYVIQESFPPSGVASFMADTEDACLALTQELDQASFVDSVSCGPRLEPGDPDPDEPVTRDVE